MKVVLVRLRRSQKVAYPEHATKVENLGLLYVGASLRREGLDTTIVDADIEELPPDFLLKRVVTLRPMVLGISVMDYSEIEQAVDLARNAREGLCGSVRIVMGGHAATYVSARILGSEVVDCVVMYEGELTSVDVCKRMATGEDWTNVSGISYLRDGQVIVNQARRRPDIEKLPFPLRDSLRLLLRKRKHVVSLVSSRGCDKNCVFCTNRDFFGPWRSRSPQSVVDELEYLCKSYAVTSVDFQDATFIGPGQGGERRAFEIADEIISRKLSIGFRISCTADSVQLPLFKRLTEAGLDGVNIGIESGTQAALDFFNKGTTVEQNIHALEVLHELHLMCHSTIGFIMFRPGSSIAEIQENIDFLKRRVVCINPKCLTNTLTIPEYKSVGIAQSLHAEQTTNVKLAKMGLSIIAAHFLEEYLSIFEAEDLAQPTMLKEWSRVVLEIAEHIVGRLTEADLTQIRVVKSLLKDASEMSAERCEEYGTLRNMTC